MATVVSTATARTAGGSSKYRAGGSNRIFTRTGEDASTIRTTERLLVQCHEPADQGEHEHRRDAAELQP